jgi:hypothetical protein
MDQQGKEAHNVSYMGERVQAAATRLLYHTLLPQVHAVEAASSGNKVDSCITVARAATAGGSCATTQLLQRRAVAPALLCSPAPELSCVHKPRLHELPLPLHAPL